MNLLWYVHRLKAMGFAEILQRIRLHVRKNSWKRQIESWPSANTKFSFDGGGFRKETFLKQSGVSSKMQSNADLYLSHRWLLFGRTFHEEEIDWHYDPHFKKSAPKIFSYDINHREESIVGDIKFTWEKNRHHHLTVLSMAYSTSKDETYAKEVRDQIFSWIEQNPVFQGVNWSHPLEHGIRLLSWVWCERLLRGSHVYDELFGPDSSFWPCVHQHMKFIRQTFCSGSSANNHLLGEMVGLYVACKAFPIHSDCEKWATLAKGVLEDELPKQTFASGLNKEQAFGYQFFVLDFALIALLEGKVFDDEFSEKFCTTTKSMLDIIPALTDVGGNYPRYGDADEGKGLQLYADSDPREAWLFRLGRRYLDAKVPTIEGGETAEALYTHLIDGAERGSEIAQLNCTSVSDEVEDAGIFVLTEKRSTPDEIFVLADAGPLGYLSIAAHGHADALSFTMSVGGLPFFVDPGTYTYYPEQKWRTYFRGTAAHNTICINGVDQSSQAGSMLWNKKASVKILEWLEGDKTLVASHDGYDPVVHTRKLQLSENLLSIEDLISGNESMELQWNFHLHPNCSVQHEGYVVEIRHGSKRVVFRADTACHLSIEKGAYSSIYAQMTDAKVLRMTYTGIPDQKFGIKIEVSE